MATDDGRIDGRRLLGRDGTRDCRVRNDATPLFLFGWCSWRAGNGALARSAERAVESDPRTAQQTCCSWRCLVGSIPDAYRSCGCRGRDESTEPARAAHVSATSHEHVVADVAIDGCSRAVAPYPRRPLLRTHGCGYPTQSRGGQAPHGVDIRLELFADPIDDHHRVGGPLRPFRLSSGVASSTVPNGRPSSSRPGIGLPCGHTSGLSSTQRCAVRPPRS